MKRSPLDSQLIRMYIDTYAKHAMNKGVYLMYKENEVTIKIVTTKVSKYEYTRVLPHSVINPIM